MPAFRAPTYTKKVNPSSGLQEPTYIFNIVFSDTDARLTYTQEDSIPVSLQCLQQAILGNVEWWNSFISDFLKASSKHFAKPYTIENINKIAKHTLIGESEYNEAPFLVNFVPLSIQISQGNFVVNWSFSAEPIVINIPDLDEPFPDSDKDLTEIDNLEELNLDEIPVDKDITDTELKVNSPAKYYELQRIKEARLKAKLAIYKVQRMVSKYYEKYGEEMSDDSDSDAESDSDFETETEYISDSASDIQIS